VIARDTHVVVRFDSLSHVYRLVHQPDALLNDVRSR
jgi:hypothetical protein